MNTRQTLIASVMLAATLSMPAHAALESRLGGQAVYDTDLNVTWLANANLAASETFGVSGIRDGGFAGQMQWDTTQSWIGAMNAANYLGYNDWRQTATSQPDASCSQNSGGVSYGYNCTGSEMGHLFYSEGVSSVTSGLFSNVQASYWSGTEFALDPAYAWSFGMDDGYQITAYKPNYGWVWAVRSGDVAAVPVPAAAWLLGSGLLGLIGIARKRKAA